jgi:hypothetical protein
MDIFQLRHAFSSGALIMVLGIGVFIICTNDKKSITS